MRASYPQNLERQQLNLADMDQQYAEFVNCAKEKDSKELRDYVNEVTGFKYGGEHLKG